VLIPSKRITWLNESATYTSPAGLTAIPNGLEKDAPNAGPPSPENPFMPVPATVVIVPEASTLRIV
jgi:hypothetical protein